MRLCLVVLLGLSACSESEPPPPDPCGAAEPAFVLTIEADQGPLPSDTLLRVSYGAGVEEHRIGTHGAIRGEVVFCASLASDGGLGGLGGAAGAPMQSEGRRCEVWVEGGVAVDVESDRYPTLHQELEAETDRCGIHTRNVELVLEPAEAGAP